MGESKSFIVSSLKAACLSLVCCLVGILVFAAIVKFAAVSTTTVKITNQFIKAVAVFIGCFFSVSGKMGILKGALGGAICTVLLYSVFALISAAPLFSLQMLADIGFTAIIGGISGIVAVNVRGKG